MSTYGCHNRAPFKPEVPVQAGWDDIGHGQGGTRIPVIVAVPFRMAKDCQFTQSELGQADTRCDGCKWRAPA